MTTMQMKAAFICAITLGSSAVAAEGCSTYPYGRGQDVITVDGDDMPKIISTERAAPFSEDIDDVDDAYDEATLAAKASISKFMSELVGSEELREEITEKITAQEGSSKKKSKTKIENITKAMSSNAQALLRGVIVLGDCYTPGKEVRVTVGLKPETLAQAAGLASATAESLQSSPTATTMQPASRGNSSAGNAQTDPGKDNLNRVEGHSNTSRFKDF